MDATVFPSEPLHTSALPSHSGVLTVTVTGRPGHLRTLALVGEADLSTASAITEAVSGLLASTEVDLHVEFDLQGLTYLDSAGVRALLMSHDLLGQGRPIALHRVQPHVRRVLLLLGLDEVFDLRP